MHRTPGARTVRKDSTDHPMLTGFTDLPGCGEWAALTTPRPGHCCGYTRGQVLCFLAPRSGRGQGPVVSGKAVAPAAVVTVRRSSGVGGSFSLHRGHVGEPAVPLRPQRRHSSPLSGHRGSHSWLLLRHRPRNKRQSRVCLFLPAWKQSSPGVHGGATGSQNCWLWGGPGASGLARPR